LATAKLHRIADPSLNDSLRLHAAKIVTENKCCSAAILKPDDSVELEHRSWWIRQLLIHEHIQT